MDDSCREILDSLRVYLDGEVPADVEEVVAAHLSDCPPCLDRADFERELKAMLASKCRERAPDTLAESLIARLRD